MKPFSSAKIKTLDRICPICCNDKGHVLHYQKFALPDHHVLPKAYDVVACIRCGFVYADTSACQSDYDRYYRDCSKYEDISLASGGGGRESDRNRLQQTASSIANKLPSRSSAILDIGCANGGLLKALHGLSFTNLTGIDPSPICVAHVSQAGITCYEGGIFEQDKLPTGIKFDCIILSHVLEHVYDLRQAVVAITALLKNGGLLYIEVPDASRYHDFYVVPYYYFDCEHINHFSEIPLANLFRRSGCKLVDVIRKSIVFSENHSYPAVGVFLKKDDDLDVTNSLPMVDSIVHESVAAYIALSAERDRQDELEALAISEEPVVVWGAGSYTLRLLEASVLGRCRIMAFIDNDSSKHGRELHGVAIHPPRKLYDLNYPIVVCAALYSNEIIEEIRLMGLTNRVVVASGTKKKEA